MVKESDPHPRAIRALVMVERGASVALLVGMLGLMVSQVVARYVLRAPIAWSEELARFSLIWLAFVASAFVMANGEHIAVDLVTRWLGRRGRVALEVFVAVVVIGTCAALVPAGWRFAEGLSGVTSPAFGIPMNVWYMAVFVGFVLLLLHAVSNIVVALIRGRSVWDRGAHEDPLSGSGA